MDAERFNPYFDVPAHLPEHDQKLIRSAHRMRWEDIEPSQAETEEGRSILDAIARRKYHIDEVRCGMG